MQNGIVLSQKDIKQILADYFNIDIENVIPSKYSYTVVGLDEDVAERLANKNKG